MPIASPTDGIQWRSIEECDEEYAKFGWKRELVFPWIVKHQRLNVIMKVTYRIHGDMLPHGCDGNKDGRLSYVQLAPSGVLMTCAYCRMTYGNVKFETCEIVSKERVSTDEALEILKQTGQIKPADVGVDTRTPGFKWGQVADRRLKR